jgi:hypothetical protein
MREKDDLVRRANMSVHCFAKSSNRLSNVVA